MKVGEKITYYRKRSKMTQEELSSELDVSRQTIYKWESGLTFPTLDNIEKLTKLFEISFDDLLDKGEERNDE